jgi:hypothetical protein
MAGRRMITPGLLEVIMRTLKAAMIGVILVAAGSTSAGGGQMLRTPSLPWANQISVMSRTDTAQRLELERLRIAERQKRLMEDTDKLLALSMALKEQVVESDKNVLSLDMVKKADQIEKLAHSVKERIKG